MGWTERLTGKIRRDGLAATIMAIGLLPYRRYRLRAEQRAHRRMLAHDTLGDRFTNIYDNNLWNSRESGSGPGSEIEYTAPLREWMIEQLPRYGIKTIVDAPCGDFNWMRLVVPKLAVDYVGLDIVASVIAKNRRKYQAENIRFEVADICTDRLPAGDLLIVRDCLFHLSFADIARFFENIAGTDYKYLLTTTHIVDDTYANTDIASGDFRRIDLFRPPFNFAPSRVVARVDDYQPGASYPRQMVLVAKPDVPPALGASCNPGPPPQCR